VSPRTPANGPGAHDAFRHGSRDPRQLDGTGPCGQPRWQRYTAQAHRPPHRGEILVDPTQHREVYAQATQYGNPYTTLRYAERRLARTAGQRPSSPAPPTATGLRSLRRTRVAARPRFPHVAGEARPWRRPTARPHPTSPSSASAMMRRGTPYVGCDTDGRPVTAQQVKAIIAQHRTVHAGVRARHRSKTAGKAPQQVLTAQMTPSARSAGRPRRPVPTGIVPGRPRRRQPSLSPRAWCNAGLS
jgi:hypothetical protein